MSCRAVFQVQGDKEDPARFQALDKLSKCAEIFLGGGVAVWMVMFQGGNHDPVWVEAQEHAVVFIGLDHKRIPFSSMRIRTAQVLRGSPDRYKRGLHRRR